MEQSKIIEITDHKTRLTQFWHPRDVIMRDEREMLLLIEPPKKQGVAAAKLNSVRVLYDTSVALISGFDPRIRIPIHSQSQEQKDLMNKAERFLIGVFRELNRMQRRLGKDSFYRELAYYVCSGWYGIFPHLENGTDFRCELYDPLTLFPEWDNEGLLRLVRYYRTTPRSAVITADSFDYNLQLHPDLDAVEIINYWERNKSGIYNTVLVDGKPVKPWTKEDFDQIPVLVGTVGGSPTGPILPGDTNWLQQRGCSVIAANRSLYKQADEWVSLLMQMVLKKAEPQILDFTESGEPALRKEDVAAGTIHHRRVGEPVQTLDDTGSTTDVNQLLSLLSGELQRGGVPYVVYGGLPFEVSGFALSQLMSAVKHKLSPYINAFAALLGDISVEFMRQYKLYGNNIELQVEKPERRNKGETFIEEFSKDDIPETRFVDVTAALSLPTDKAQQYVLARQAMQQPQLASRPTLWDELLDIQDASLEYERIIEDQMLELPVMKTIMLIERLRDKAEAFTKQNKQKMADALNRYADQVEMTISQPQQSTQAAQQGIAPASMPNEQATGGIPDEIKAALSLNPPGDNGNKAVMPQGGMQ